MIGSPFSTLALTKFQPRYWLPLCTMLWSICVLGIHAAQNVETVYGLRYGNVYNTLGLPEKNLKLIADGLDFVPACSSLSRLLESTTS